MPKHEDCKQCEADQKNSPTAFRFIKKKTTCFVCEKIVSQVLDLIHTNADLCSLKCEAQYWLDKAATAKNDGCKQCKADEKNGLPLFRFKKKKTTCFVCQKKVSQVLDLHHTNASLCSLKCEAQYWLDIAYS